MQKFQIFVIGFAFAAILLIPVNDAFAAPGTISIITRTNDAFVSCTGSDPEGCYNPKVATVASNGIVTMFNMDNTESHTFTSGSSSNPMDGTFHSGLLSPGQSFEWIVNTNEGVWSAMNTEEKNWFLNATQSIAVLPRSFSSSLAADRLSTLSPFTL